MKTEDIVLMVLIFGQAIPGFGLAISLLMWPGHEKRLEKFRKEWDIVPPQQSDLSNDRNKAPRLDQE